ncbi:neutral and basic amino acid transport protein rBAT [Erpetoichthys calabaricus]|uniref:Neutral and basic amino acid transport protein rBAT-like n=1 Tax=Erpetoichthys calabaricus TaxID=27687 RepID=A0A8C4RFQ2_ERPCA|nr:neutral and basic amino acid transport protein rBAT [Erpetoichthys calabaricus]XP_028651549.1 neutral and basic amino acid transport protein rBAT [Erpetoichthys calabaricus]
MLSKNDPTSIQSEEDPEKRPLLHSTSDNKWLLLGLEELKCQAGGPRWKAFRTRLLIILSVAWMGMLGTAIAIIVQSLSAPSHTLEWWEMGSFYQLEVPVFCDSNSDEIGDLNGILIQLPYLQSLKVNALLLGSLYSRDGSVQPSNLTSINATLGTTEDFKKLLLVARGVGIRILLDFCNETWLRDPVPTESQGGSVMSKVKNALRFWLDLDVAGFRICNEDLLLTNKTLLHWRRELKHRSPDKQDNQRVLIISDVNGGLRAEATAFQKTNGSLAPLLYTQQLLPPSVKGSSLHEAVHQALQGQPTSWPTWVVGGPGVGHMASQVADLQRLFAVLSFTLPGPHFIYYGDEIGLAELQSGSPTNTPSMKWKAHQKSGATGSSTGVSSKGDLDSVEAQLHIRNSTLHLFQSLASLRLREVALRSSEFSLIPTNATTVLAFSRSWRCSRFLVVLNFGESLTTELPVGPNSRGAVVLSSYMNRRDSVFPSTLFLAAREALVIKLAANEQA